MRILAREYPHLVDGYERLYAGKYATASYTDEVQRMVGLLKARYGLARRKAPAEGVDAEPASPAGPRQIPMRLVRSRSGA
jgi:hypothetical protein